jgi:hypothetical protein
MFKTNNFPTRQRSSNQTLLPGNGFSPLAFYQELDEDYPDRTSDSQGYTTGDYEPTSRPTSIAIIVGLITFGMVLSLAGAFYVLKYPTHFPRWFWLAALPDYVILITSLVGLWNMKKYGAWAFVVQAVLGVLIVQFFNNPASAYSGSIVTIVLTALIFRKYNEME